MPQLMLNEHELYLLEMAVDQTLYMLKPNTETYKEYEKLDKQIAETRYRQQVADQKKLKRERFEMATAEFEGKAIRCVDDNVLFRNIDEAVRYSIETRGNCGSAGNRKRGIQDCLLGKYKTAYSKHWKLETGSTGSTDFYYKEEPNKKGKVVLHFV